jgi:hypothetical protein
MCGIVSDVRTLVDGVIAVWRRTNPTLEAPVSPASISAFERDHRVRLPVALRELYLRADGCEWDENATQFLPLGEIKPLIEVVQFSELQLAEFPRARTYFVFVDYLISSHYFAVALTDDANAGEVLAIVNARMKASVAPTLEQFLHDYTQDSLAAVLFPDVESPT